MYAITKDFGNIYPIKEYRPTSHTSDASTPRFETKEPTWGFVKRGRREVYTIIFPTFESAKRHCLRVHESEHAALQKKAEKVSILWCKIKELHEAHVLA